ncbi:hypothetical protein [Paenibacillus kobensis]|uniref:hypothetical protein n=1 Tax=Paenibacillus kobensis TaxID=59841 RepID=UPI000FDB526A|nr:hypothetical protein [Paenibacillus kobensis]
MNPIAILLLGFIPGVGHYLIGRKGRTVVYPLIIIGFIVLGILMAMESGDGDPFIVCMLIGFGMWCVQMADLMIGLFRFTRVPGLGVHGQQALYNGPGNSAGWAAGVGAGTGFSNGPMPGHGAGEGTAASWAGSGEMNGEPSYAGGAFGGVGGWSGYAGGQSYGNSAQHANERFYTILLSFLPGLGHLQIGLLQRGMTFMVGFFGLFMMILFVSVLSHQSGFLVFLGALPIIWIYSMFDAVRMQGRKQAGEILEDRSVLEDWERHRENGKRSRWVAILLSILPGAGHMYLGLQRRGFQLMAAFFLAFYLLDTLRLSLFLMFLPLLWCYSLFDALQQVSRAEAGYEPLVDRPIVDGLMNRKRWVGVGLLLLGAYYIFDQVGVDLIQDYYNDFSLTYEIKNYVQTGLVSLAFILGGVKLMLGGKRKQTAREEM